MVDVRIMYVAFQGGGMALQLLEYLGFEVGVIEDLEYFQDALQGGAAVPL